MSLDGGEDGDSTLEPRNNVIHYILNNSCSKFPIKHSDIVSKALHGNGEVLHSIFDYIKAALEDTYGILLKSVPEAKGGKSYICVSKFPAVSSIEHDASQRSNITLLFLVVSYIFMKGVPVSEDCLEVFLKGLRIYFDRPHEVFGNNVKKLITETFVKQLYLKKSKNDVDSAENTFLYSWGFRSLLEFPQKDVLEAVSKLLNKPAKHFVMQYAQAKQRVEPGSDDD